MATFTSKAEIALGQGVWPLVHDLAHAMRRELGRAPRFFVAAPCYGVLPPTLEAAGAAVELGPLHQLYASKLPPDAVVISQPSNPEGCYLPREELVALAAYASEHRCRIVSDEIFGLVNLTHQAAETVRSPVTLEQAVPGTSGLTVLLGGLSKEFAAGGMRVGWLATHDAALALRVREAALGRLQLTMARAGSHLYAAFGRSGAGKLVHPRRHRALREHLVAMRRELAQKRALVVAALPEAPAVEEAGGLFLAPLVRAWLGRSIDGVRLTPENLPRQIYERTHVVVNGGAWCGDPERIRLVFSIPEEKLRRAAAGLRAFGEALEP
jgi:aspartate/methionine/tyrosine aminotransferase